LKSIPGASRKRKKGEQGRVFIGGLTIKFFPVKEK